MPKVVPQGVSPSYERSVRQLDHLGQNDRIRHELERAKLEISERTPYGETSEHSWVLDRALAAGKRSAPPDVAERLNRGRAAAEKETRAVGSSTLGGLIPAVIEPYVAEAVAYGVRSTAVLATSLLRLDLPPVGMNVAWAKVTTSATVGGQTAESAAVTTSADAVVASATDPLATIAASLDFSAQGRERSGGWLDKVLGEELGRAFGARLEQQVWAGTGANQQLKGLTVMTGNSTSNVSGQTLALTVNQIANGYQTISANLGSPPDILALAPRRYAALEAATGALGLEASNLLPQGVELVISPAAPLTLGGGTEDWPILINRGAIPLVADPQPRLEFQAQGSTSTALQFRFVIYSFAALGVSRRPEGVHTIKLLTPPTFA
jgi:hypothetical protein